jgi:hypothetical protein
MMMVMHKQNREEEEENSDAKLFEGKARICISKSIQKIFPCYEDNM